MRKVLRFFPIICLLLLLGCSVQDADAPATTAPSKATPTAVVLATGRPATPEPPAPTTEPTPPPEEVLRQIEQLERIDRKTAVLYVNTDRFLVHEYLRDPEIYGASLTGPFRYEDGFREFFTESARSLLKELHDLDREVLGSSDTVVYDTLDRFLTSSVTAYDNPLIFDPLSDDGPLLSIAENLLLFRIENEEDILFLSDTIRAIPSVVEEAVSMELDRISNGYIRSETRLRFLDAWCDDILNEKGSAVSKALKEHINQADGMTRKQKKSYADEISALLKENLFPAVETLKENISIWEKGLADISIEVPEENGENYRALLSWITQSDMSPESIAELLEASADDLTYLLSRSDTEQQADAFKGSRISNSISMLKRISREMVDGVPDSRLKLVKVPDKLSDAMTRPYILTRPALDGEEDWQQLLYYAEEGRKDGLFPEIARIYYPGEALIDAVCFSSDTIGMFQKVYGFPCYRKGWAGYAAEQAIIRQSAFEAEDALCEYARGLLFGEIIPALADIRIHDAGYDREHLKEYFQERSLDLSEDYIASLYEESADCPAKHLSAAYGYAFFCDMMKRMSSVLGERYLDSAVHARVLGIGPCGFDIVREVMDEWADGQISG